MNLPYFIAQKLIKGRRQGTSFSKPINIIAITGIALGLAVMIIAVSTLTGFKLEIRNKVVGFGSDIQLLNFDSNQSFETVPINSDLDFIEKISTTEGVKHLQVFATKAGIIKTDKDIQGVYLKGIGPDFDWDYFESNMVEGKAFHPADTGRALNSVVLSKKLATMLSLGLGDSISMHFIQNPPRSRRFVITGIYETNLEEFDRIFIFCDIKHVRRLNGWEENQVSGFEIFINDFDRLEEMTGKIRDIIGYRIEEKAPKVKVMNIREKYPQIFDWLGFQDLNVVIIIVLMLIVAGFNMISGILILMLEKTNMIGILKALGTEDKTIRKIFIYQAAYLIGKGLLWGNIIGIGICIFQLQTGFLTLNPSSYYLKTVPVNLDALHIILLNAGTMIAIIAMLLIPSQIVSRITPVKAIRFD